MKKIFALLTLPLLTAAAAEMSWNSTETLKLWQANKNVQYNVNENIGRMTNIGRDSSIIIKNLDLDPTQYNTFSYKYRAAAGPVSARGQLYFAGPDGIIKAGYMWRLPRLLRDGKWHTVTLSAKNIIDQKAWYNAEKITALRFDPTDSAGGEIEIAELKFSFIPGNGGDLSLLKKNPAIWNKSNNFSGWRAGRNLTCQPTPDGLKLTLLKRDSRIINDSLVIDPAECNTLIYRYRAQGASGNGQLFFAVDGGEIGHGNYWRLPHIIADGKIHTVTVPASRLRDPDAWFKAKRITTLRFDPTNNAGGTFELLEIRFEKRRTAPAAAKVKKTSAAWQPIKHTRRMTSPAWQPVTAKFDDSQRSKVDDVLFTQLHSSGSASYFQGKMIYESCDLNSQHSTIADKTGLNNTYSDFFLRKEFELKSSPVQAKIQIVADDRAKFYLNGQYAGEVKSWSTPAVLDVKKFLRSGKNVLGIHYTNTHNAGGVLAELFVEFADKSFVRINTDETFVGTIAPPDDWHKPGADTKNFQPVKSAAPPPAPPWVKKLSYVDFSMPQRLKNMQIIPRNAVAGQKVKIRFDFSGKCPKLPIHSEISLKRGRFAAWKESLLLDKNHVRRQADNRWVIDIDYVLPEYISGGKIALELTSDSIYITDGKKMIQFFDLQSKKAAGFDKKPLSVVKNGAYGPYFELNGKPLYHLSGRVATFSLPDPPTNVVVVQPAWFDWWTPEGDLVLEEFDRCAEMARRNEGNNYFIWDLTINFPKALLADYPDDICRDDHGMIVRDGYASKRNCYSFASVIALQKMRETMLKAIEYLENSPYANRIIGYRICGGHTIEWLAWSAPRGRCLDFSPAAQRKFKEYARKFYPELKDTRVPTLAERQARDDNGLLCDPVKHRKAIAYNDYYSNATVDYVIDLCQTAKKALNNQKLVGTYYGYTMTLNSDGRSQMRGHYALKKLLDSRCVDFLMSPQPYNVRNFGETYGDMKPFATMKKYNIVPFHEDDTRTHMGKGHGRNYQAPNVDLCVEILRRSMGFNLCRNMPILYIPMPGNYEFPEARHDFRIVEKVGQHCLDKQVTRKAEIALIASEKSIIYSPTGHPGIPTGEIEQSYSSTGKISRSNPRARPAAFAYDSFGRNYNLYNQLGAPADYLLAEDILENPGDYKMYVFINATFTDKKLQEAARRLRSKKCLILWMYAPGYTTYEKNSVESMKLLTGLDFRKAPDIMMPALTMNDKRIMGTPTVRMSPLFSVTTPGGEVLGRYEDGSVGAAVYKTGAAETVFCGVWRPDLKFLRELARRANIRIYSTSGDPLEANESLIALHARTGGKKSIKLPQKCDVLDVFNRKIIARNTDQFSFEVKLHDSLLFYYGNDADKLLQKIEKAFQ